MPGQNREETEATEATFDLMETLDVLEPCELEAEQTVAEGLVVRHRELGERRGVTIEPCFPVTEPGRYMVLRDADGSELGLLEDVQALSTASREAFEVEMAKQHFVPVITRVEAIYREYQVPIWEVETDRGPRRIELKSSHDAHRLPGGRIYLRDAEGNAYLIPDYRELDPASQDMIDLFM